MLGFIGHGTKLMHEDYLCKFYNIGDLWLDLGLKRRIDAVKEVLLLTNLNSFFFNIDSTNNWIFNFPGT